MKTNRFILFGLLVAVACMSCVSKKVLKTEQAKYIDLQTQYGEVQSQLKNCNDLTMENAKKKAELEAQINALKKQVDYLTANNNQALKQLENLSVISSSQAESIKKSLDNIGSKDAYIQGLQTALNQKDSLNLVLVTNLKGAIGNMDDKDINIKVDKGVVFIDISDKLLFKSGKYEVTDQAKTVLGKVALVLKNQPDMEYMVEGHTDNVPFKNAVLLDNLDLSVKRATSVVRILKDQYGINPAQLTAAGRGEYLPIADNSTPEGKMANRRTRIIIMPKLDQFFKLLEKK